jgi:histone H3/H4
MSREDERFRRERVLEQEKRERLKRSAVEAFTEWVGEIAKQVVKKAVKGLMGWLRSLFQ